MGALVAFGVLRLSDAWELDRVACHVGVGVAALLGAGVAWAVHRLRRHPRWAVARWGLVPAAGALAGMSVQAAALRIPVTVVGSPTGLTKADPLTWVLAGAPIGAVPAVLVALVLRLSLQVIVQSGQVPPLDTRERMILPAAGASLILGTLGLYAAGPREMPIVLLAVGLAFAAVGEVVVRDILRARWLKRVFAGDPSFGLVPLDETPSGDLPAVVGGVPAEIAIVTDAVSVAGYRLSNRKLLAVTASRLAIALGPIERRRGLAGGFVGVALVLGAAFGLAR